MYGLIMEIKASSVIVMTKDGGFDEWTMRTEGMSIGQEIKKPISGASPISLKAYLTNRKRSYMRIAAGLLMAVMIGGTGSWAYYTPYGYVNVDINPSIEMTYNRFERVIDVKSINDDGSHLVSETHDIKNKKVSDAIEAIVERSEESGYLQDDDKYVLVTVTKVKDDSEDISEELDLVAQWAESEAIVVENLESSLENYETSVSENVSPGKKMIVSEAKRILEEKLDALDDSEAIDALEEINEKTNLGQLMKIIRSEDKGGLKDPESSDLDDKTDKVPPGQEKKENKNQDKNKPQNDKKGDSKSIMETEEVEDAPDAVSDTEKVPPGQEKKDNATDSKDNKGQSNAKKTEQVTEPDAVDDASDEAVLDEDETGDEESISGNNGKSNGNANEKSDSKSTGNSDKSSNENSNGNSNGKSDKNTGGNSDEKSNGNPNEKSNEDSGNKSNGNGNGNGKKK